LKHFFAVFVLLFSVSIMAEHPGPRPVTSCNIQVPFGLPQVSNRPNTVTICRNNYVTVNDLNAKIPVFVAYTLTPEHAIGCLPRKNQFATDQSLPQDHRATPTDYAKSGYDIGHMDPDADNAFDDTAMRESFILSNMAPQVPLLNRQGWEKLEDRVREWAVNSQHSLTIYVGPIYSSYDSTIGNGVKIPHGFFKVIVDDTTHHVLEFVYPQAPVSKQDDLRKYLVNDLPVEIGVSIPLPLDAVIDSVPWDNQHSLLTTKKKVCQIAK